MSARGDDPSAGRVDAVPPRASPAVLAGRVREIARAFGPWGRRVAASPGDWLMLLLAGGRAAPPKGSPEAFRAALERLGPVFIKAGQLLSTRPDLLARPYLDALQSLHARVPPMSRDEVSACLARYTRALGYNPFERFEPAPLAAASLAQVHRATLRDGTAVAVKLRRPGVEAVVERDLLLLDLSARVVGPRLGGLYDLAGFVEELTLTLRDELDFRAEAESLAVFSRNLAAAADPLVRVPEVWHELTTEAVLVTELIRGRPLSEPLRALPAERRRALARATAHAYFQMFFIDGVFHADPHPGNLLLTDDDAVVILDFGMVGRIERQLADNLVRVLLNFWLKDSHGVAHAFLDIGKPTREADELGWVLEVRRLLPRYHGVRLERLNLGALLIDLLRGAARCGIQTPSVVGLICKSLANMDGSVRLLDPDVDVLGTFHAFIPRLLEAHARRLASPEQLAKVALDTQIGSQRIPFQLASILEKAATGRLRLVLDPLAPAARGRGG